MRTTVELSRRRLLQVGAATAAMPVMGAGAPATASTAAPARLAEVRAAAGEPHATNPADLSVLELVVARGGRPPAPTGSGPPARTQDSWAGCRSV